MKHINPCPQETPDILPCTLDLLVFKTLAQEPQHGYGIAPKILVMSREALKTQHGSLCPALHRLEKKGLIGSEWKESEAGRMAKFYSMRPAGQKRLQTEQD